MIKESILSETFFLYYYEDVICSLSLILIDVDVSFDTLISLLNHWSCINILLKLLFLSLWYVLPFLVLYFWMILHLFSPVWIHAP